MKFTSTRIPGVVVVDIEPVRDSRGFFARAWSPDEFSAAGIDVEWAQENVAFNEHKGTLRGLHFQLPPHAETKLVRCTRGRVWDVAVDLRPASPTFAQSTGVELNADNRRSLLVPVGCAHGYLTLSDHVEMRYLTSHPYAPQAASGVRYDDPALAVEWPEEVRLLSENDRTWQLLDADADPRLFHDVGRVG
jgi:dTDP-4-dehydrorhamnose 3,5-epimerase